MSTGGIAWTGWTLVLVLGLLLGQSCAFADSYELTYQVTASAVDASLTNSQSLGNPSVQQSSVTAGPVSATENNVWSSGLINDASGASAVGTLQFGSLTGTVSGNAGESSSFPGFTPGENINGTVGGNGGFDGAWTDTLTITSNSLFAGAPVQLAFTLVTTFTTTCSGDGSASVTAQDAINVSGPEVLSASDNTCNANLNNSQQFIYSTVVGATIPILGQIQLNAGAYVANDETETVTVDPDTNVYIDSLTPGASYAAASGTNYSTPTPEPSSLLMLGSGLLALLGIAKRKVVA